VVALPQQVGAATNGPPKMDIVGTNDALVSVSAQMDAVVAARTGFVGGTVAAGQPIYSLVDPGQTWVKANIDEASIWRVAVGQPVEVHVDALNRVFTGRVEAITPASSATFSLLPSGNVSGNFIKVTQYVPIKISVDSSGIMLPLGTSVEVRVRVREQSSPIPMPWQP
jgi:membrane fusion protein (multidrug efflux system)